MVQKIPNCVNRLVEILGGDAVHIPKRPGEKECPSAGHDHVKITVWLETTDKYLRRG